jgi:hypothetical protein
MSGIVLGIMMVGCWHRTTISLCAFIQILLFPLVEFICGSHPIVLPGLLRERYADCPHCPMSSIGMAGAYLAGVYAMLRHYSEEDI